METTETQHDAAEQRPRRRPTSAPIPQAADTRPLRPCKGCGDVLTRAGWCSNACFRAEDGGDPRDW